MEFEIGICKYGYEHIPLKIKWINDPYVNKYLHYNLPIDEVNEKQWLSKVIDDKSRHDCVIEVVKENEHIPVGLIGLIHIDNSNRKAEFYVSIGEHEFNNKGIAYLASMKFLRDTLYSLNLNKVYLYTEVENNKAQILFEKIGFMKEGLLRSDLIYNGKMINRYIYGLLIEDFFD